MDFYKKGAEDVFKTLGIEEPPVIDTTKQLIEKYTPEPIKDVQEELAQSYRATPYNVLFGRYKDTTRGLLSSAKERLSDLFH